MNRERGADLMRFVKLRSLKTGTLACLAAMAATFVFPQSGGSVGLALQLPVRGIVRASSQATLSTDLTAFVTRIGFREGQHFLKGDVLIAFDCRMQEAQLAAAEATRREKKVAFKSANYLFRQNAGSKQDVETARALSEKASAESDVIRAKLDRCEIRAPYDGNVSELNISEHEMSVVGTPMLSIVRTGAPEIELIVPSTWLNAIKPGLKFDFLVDETRKTYTGVVKRTGATVDAVSQTIRVFAEFSKPETAVLPGMSGTAKFDGFK